MTINEERWREIKAFVAEWCRPLLPEDGYTPVEMDAVEEQIGRKLPQAVREWYELAGRFKQITDHQNHLVTPTELEIGSYWDVLDEAVQAESNPADYPIGLEIYNENQNVYGWKILETDLDIPDPPVYLEDADRLFGEEALYREAHSFTEFVFKMIAMEILYAGPMGTSVVQGDPVREDTVQLIEQRLTPLSALPLSSSVYFWRGKGVLLGTMDTGESFELIAMTLEEQERVKGELSDLIAWDG